VTLEFRVFNESIDHAGLRPSEGWDIEFILDEVESPELRHRLRVANERYEEIKPYPMFPHPTDDPEEFLGLIEPWLDEVEAREAAETKASEEEKLREDEVLRRFRLEQRGWISEHGSERLRAALAGGYKVNTSYTLERAESELPGFWVDTAEDSEWEERADPSFEALAIESAARERLAAIDPDLEVRIVWLTETPRSLDQKLEQQGWEFEPQEAILVRPYLGRYVLVMPLDRDLHRDTEEDS
jgi:hypothetical protein